LQDLGFTTGPVALVPGNFAVLVGMTYTYLPFMVLPIYASLEKIDPALTAAAADLGARPMDSFLSVILPLSLPGVLAGALLVFVPSVGEFVVPELLQHDATPDALAGAVLQWLDSPQRCDAVAARFLDIHQLLRRDTARAATDAIAAILAR
ncbi:MAG TPA: ABC transporter permease subunit, partial [Burkholderiaceae bacterium]|nr:ABC transporter permease subunit [Burkholderiaceae bacterium]